MKKLIKKILRESDFDWVTQTPNYDTVGEIKTLYGGFRELFKFGDIVTLKGHIPCESIRNEGCVIYLDDSKYEVMDVMRTRIKVKPLNDLVLHKFYDEWDDDSVWIGIEKSDDDITIEKLTNLNESDFDWTDNIKPQSETCEDFIRELLIESDVNVVSIYGSEFHVYSVDYVNYFIIDLSTGDFYIDKNKVTNYLKKTYGMNYKEIRDCAYNTVLDYFEFGPGEFRIKGGYDLDTILDGSMI